MQVVKDIMQWIVKPDNHPICWLRGPAGWGKSAIALSVATACDERGLLAASFFFYRGHAERSNPQRLFPTIAYQLGIAIPSLKDEICRAIQADPSTPYKTIDRQLEKLIIDPLFALHHPLALRRVVVIDALDECNDNESIKDILAYIAQAVPRYTVDEDPQYHVPLQFIITSRPEIHIQAKFKELQLVTHVINLSDFDAQNDIRIFLSRSFEKIHQDHSDAMFDVPKPWPSNDDFERLVEESAGLFIYASTLAKFIGDPCENPKRKLATVLQCLQGERAPGSSPYAGLDALYKQILCLIPRNHLQVLAKIILLVDPLPLRSLGDLLQLEIGDLRVALRGLYSILSVPDQMNEPIHTLHKSLPDFLVDEERSEVYCIELIPCHTNLADRCLAVLCTNLKRDICNIGDSSKLNSEVADLAQIRDEFIGGALAYACRHWAYHLLQALPDNDLEDKLRKFLFGFTPYWIETLSLLGSFRMAQQIIQSATQWVKVRLFILIVVMSLNNFSSFSCSNSLALQLTFWNFCLMLNNLSSSSLIAWTPWHCKYTTPHCHLCPKKLCFIKCSLMNCHLLQCKSLLNRKNHILSTMQMDKLCPALVMGLCIPLALPPILLQMFQI